jgi:hypothetical protein
MAVLRDDDLVVSDETAGSSPGWLHETLPVATGYLSADCFRGFGGADGFVASAAGEE